MPAFNSTNYLITLDSAKYLSTPESREAFLAGCRTAIALINDAHDKHARAAILNGTMDDEALLAVVPQRHDTAILQCLRANKDRTRALIFGFSINDNGYAVDEDGDVIEDGWFNLLSKCCSRQSYPDVLACHKHTGSQIAVRQYGNLTPEERQQYDTLRYADLEDENGNNLGRIIEGDMSYLPKFIVRDARAAILNKSPLALRYISACGQGNDSFPRGSLYPYRQQIANIARKLGFVGGRVAVQIADGCINSLAQFYLVWLQGAKNAIICGRRSLKDFESWELRLLEEFFVMSDECMTEHLTDTDIETCPSFENLGHTIDGVIYVDGRSLQIESTDERCDIAAKLAYIRKTISDLSQFILCDFEKHSEALYAYGKMQPDWGSSLIDLIDTLEYLNR